MYGQYNVWIIYSISIIDRNDLLTRDEGDFENVSKFKYLRALITENNEVGKEVNLRLNLGNICYYLVQGLLSSEDTLETLN